MDLGLEDKRVLITGATRGIGLATARVFAEERARVAITYHTSDAVAKRVVEELGGEDRACALRCDLADPASIREAVGAVESRWGGVDVVVANAQTWVWVNPEDLPPYQDFPMDYWLARFRENVEGHMWTVRQALGGMRERGWGRIVLLSSVTATHGNPGSELYSAAKASLHGFARALMWTRDGVLANVVAPGGTLTESLEAVAPELLEQAARETPSGRLSTAEEVARVIVFLCSEANGNINGEVVHTAGGR
ncbi:SDR family NAD(P)-dependent oxidoreductase [Streptosporangium roseum]|uniref:Acetoacetyl-CoA reductase n=1 Tax=Streptosporangium roseum (strain ATCC 12428 / DSM 43021 / JCM 3005 / KCTC 9067 / NCIMB 10171 / NRRL 2505 / NI 9100) TaxID=479432 RepID=D2AY70_STRRD|nr:SDR family oxidoreductase [Streptosporangium roseum]ACZ87080.1 acetoacetyl-CoA reductase [Streptosporangium roseum DSM 43021]